MPCKTKAWPLHQPFPSGWERRFVVRQHQFEGLSGHSQKMELLKVFSELTAVKVVFTQFP